MTAVAAINQARSTTSESAPWRAVALAAVTLFILAVAGPLLDWIKGHHQAERDHAGLIKECTKLPVDDGRRLPLVQERTPEQLAPRNAITQIPYLRRFAEDHVLAPLALHRRVLVHGHSMAGKSRTCAHLITQRYPHRRLLHPIPEQFGHLLGSYTPHDTVVWLDDLDRCLNAAGLRDDWDEVLTRNGNIIVATIRTSAYNTITQGGDVRHPHADSLDRFKNLDAVVEVTDSKGERQLLAQQMPDESSRALVATHGLGEYLGGGYLAIERYRTCEPDRYPYRRPVVNAAVDWRRIGLDTIPTDTLLTLAREYPTTSSPLRTTESPAQALEWATRTISEVVHLIDPVDNSQMRATDFMLDHLSGSDVPPVPETTWATALTLALSPTELFSLGLAALQAERVAAAREAWQRATRAPDADISAMAAVSLGTIEEGEGDIQSARKAYRIAINSRHEVAAPLAAVNLGAFEHQDGDLEAARHTYRIAINSGYNDAAPLATLNLGILEEEDGDLEAARHWYTNAANSGHKDAAPMGALRLGTLDCRSGNLEAARHWYTNAANSGHKDAAPMGAFNLGILEQLGGNLEAARNAYRVAVNSGHIEVTHLAIELLQLLDS